MVFVSLKGVECEKKNYFCVHQIMVREIGRVPDVLRGGTLLFQFKGWTLNKLKLNKIK